MKSNTSALALRPTSNFIRPSLIRPFLLSRFYATQTGLGATTSPSARRRKVTAFNDDGFVPWKQLSAGEKASRAIQQSFNFGIIVVGTVLLGGVAYFMWHDVFSPDSKISQFNRAIDKIKDDPRCVELLGNPRKITAHGDETFNKWRRARPVSSMERTDPDGTQHLIMHFYVEGPLNQGVARQHLIKPRDADEFYYQYLFVDIKGQERVYLEKHDGSSGKGKKPFSFFGVKWS